VEGDEKAGALLSKNASANKPMLFVSHESMPWAPQQVQFMSACSVSQPLLTNIVVAYYARKKKRKTTEAVKHSLHQVRKKSLLGPKHRMTLPPPKKTREVSGDQGDD